MAAIDANHHRPRVEQGWERNEPPILVRQVEPRHKITKLRAKLSTINYISAAQTSFIICSSEIGVPITARFTIRR